MFTITRIFLRPESPLSRCVKPAPFRIRAPLTFVLLAMSLLHLSAAPDGEALTIIPVEEKYPQTVCSKSGKTCATIREFVDETKPSWQNKTYSIELPASKDFPAGCLTEIPYQASSKNVLVLDKGLGVIGLHVWKNNAPDGKPQQSVIYRTTCNAAGLDITHESLLAHSSKPEEKIWRRDVVSSWFKISWIEHSKNRFHHLLHTGEILSVDLISGKIQKRPNSELTRATSYTTGHERLVLLVNAIDSRAPGIRKLSKRLAMDTNEASSIRLRAANFVRKELPPNLVEQLFLETASTGNADDEWRGDRQYALEHLSDVVGFERAKDSLVAGLHQKKLLGAAERGFVAAGVPAVQTLVDVLSTSESANAAGFAAHALARIASCKAADPLHAAVRDKREYVANAALNALRDICPLDIRERLSELSKQSTTQQEFLDQLLDPAQYPANKICRKRDPNPHRRTPLPRYQDCGTGISY